jgi:hypothetical protein
VIWQLAMPHGLIGLGCSAIYAPLQVRTFLNRCAAD